MSLKISSVNYTLDSEDTGGALNVEVLPGNKVCITGDEFTCELDELVNFLKPLVAQTKPEVLNERTT